MTNSRMENILNDHSIQEWAEARKQYFSVNHDKIPIFQKFFTDIDFSNYDFSCMKFVNCKFEKCNMLKCDLRATSLTECTFKECILDGVLLGKKALGNEGNSDVTKFSSCELYFCSIKNVDYSKLEYMFNKFKDCDLGGSKFNQSRVHAVDFASSDLSKVSFAGAKFEGNVLWDGCFIDAKTDFRQAIFVDTSYNVDLDKSELIKFRGFDNFLNWKHIRFLSEIPIFNFSWFVFLGVLFLINSIRLLNDGGLLFPALQLPAQAVPVLLSSLFLGLGAFIFKIYCPPSVQNFSEEKWVYELRKPRPVYRAMLLQKVFPLSISLILLLLGGLIGLLLLVPNFMNAVGFIMKLHGISFGGFF